MIAFTKASSPSSWTRASMYMKNSCTGTCNPTDATTIFGGKNERMLKLNFNWWRVSTPRYLVALVLIAQESQPLNFGDAGRKIVRNLHPPQPTQPDTSQWRFRGNEPENEQAPALARPWITNGRVKADQVPPDVPRGPLNCRGRRLQSPPSPGRQGRVQASAGQTAEIVPKGHPPRSSTR